MLIFHADSMRVFAGRHVGERGVIATRYRAFDDVSDRAGVASRWREKHASAQRRICRWR